MKGAFLQRLDQWLRQRLPFGLTLLLVMCSVMPTRLPGFATVVPMLPLISVYYWSIYRPDLLPAPLAFLIGIATDIVWGTPLGVTSLIFLVVQFLVSSQRRFFLTRPFLTAWWGFVLVGTVASLCQWLLISMMFGRVLDFHAGLFELLMTLSFYPLLSWLFARTQLTLLRTA